MWLEWVVMKSTFIYQQSLNENDIRAPLHFKVVKKKITLCFSKYIYLMVLVPRATVHIQEVNTVWQKTV